MEFLPEIFEAEDGYCDITNAFCFAKDTVFILINAMSEDEELHGSALLKVNLTAEDPTYELLHEFDAGSLDYHCEHPGLHFVLASGGNIHRIENGNMTFHRFAANAFLPKLARIDARTVAVFGEEGLAFRFSDGPYTQMPTPTDERLYAMHFPRPNHGYAGGNYGTFLLGDGAQFTTLDIGGGEAIRGLHVKADESVLLACTNGVGLVYLNEELTRAEGATSDFYSVNEFKGVEYWGDDDFGLYTREGTAFTPRFNTEYGFNINTTPELMTVNAGYSVFIFDGSDWIKLQINPDIDNLIERVPANL